jgi:hypothetical protein
VNNTQKKEYLFLTNARNPFLGRIIRTVKISTILGDFLPSAPLPPPQYVQRTASLKIAVDTVLVPREE